MEPPSTQPKLSCVSWRQTGGCDPNGAAESSHDKPCAQTIKTGDSGYCECQGAVRRNSVNCVHESFSCNQACDGNVVADAVPPPPPPPPPAITSLTYSDPAAEAARTQHRAAETEVST